MTTKDKTGDKLVASIRRTKSGAGTGTTAAKTTAAAPAKKRASKRRVSAKTAPAKQATAKSGDSYQSAGRVWPD
jgi:hypothetical protein